MLASVIVDGQITDSYELPDYDTIINERIAVHAALITGAHGAGSDTIATDANIDTDVAAHAALNTVPSGVIFPYGVATPPAGYLLCDGAAVSRTTYANLFAAIGVVYGVGDGSTTFNLPDSAGNVPVGIGGSGVTNLADTGGAQTHTLITDEMPVHTHNQATRAGSGSHDYITHDSDSYYVNDLPTSSAGGGGSHNNMQPYFGVEYIIKT